MDQVLRIGVPRVEDNCKLLSSEERQLIRAVAIRLDTCLPSLQTELYRFVARRLRDITNIDIVVENAIVEFLDYFQFFKERLLDLCVPIAMGGESMETSQVNAVFPRTKRDIQCSLKHGRCIGSNAVRRRILVLITAPSISCTPTEEIYVFAKHMQSMKRKKQGIWETHWRRRA